MHLCNPLQLRSMKLKPEATSSDCETFFPRATKIQLPQPSMQA
jgi:hypothetical protein